VGVSLRFTNRASPSTITPESTKKGDICKENRIVESATSLNTKDASF
jgi:hypothetical protein